MEKTGLMTGPAIFMALMLASFYIFPPLMLAVCAGLVFYASYGVRHAIEALTLSFLIGFLNPGIFAFPEGISGLRWLILLAAFARVLYTMLSAESYTLPRPVLHLLYFSLVCITLAVAVSFQPMISIFKIVMFTLGVFTVLMAFQFTSEMKAYWTHWFTHLYFFVILASLPFMFMAVGYYNNEAGFQGILNQPQSFGLFIAPFTAYFTSKLLFNKNYTYVDLAGMLLGWVNIFASQARMAFLAVTLSIILLIVYRMIRGLPSIVSGEQKQLSYSSLVAACLAGIILIFNAEIILDKFGGFIQKNYEFEDLGEGFHQSRGFLIERSMNNFYEYPIMGIGFGIDSRLHDRTMDQQQFMGIPLGAPTEKGFLISAVLEEIGIIGTVAFAVFLGSLILFVFSMAGLTNQALFLACLFVNIGEMVFFAFGGLGLYIWLLMGYAGIKSREPDDGIPRVPISPYAGKVQGRMDTAGEPLTEHTFKN